jgi:pimeloyl-ACP methyl ester carboxylesterase
LPGHGNAGNVGDRLPHVELLSARFDVLAFDYRGYGRSTGRPSEQGLYRDASAARDGGRMQDAQDGVEAPGSAQRRSAGVMGRRGR